MTTSLAGILRQLNKLPHDVLRPGATLEERGDELRILETLVPPTLLLRCDFSSGVRITRGCILIDTRIWVCVHIANGVFTEVRASLDDDGRAAVMRGTELVTPTPSTPESFSSLIEDIGFGKRI